MGFTECKDSYPQDCPGCGVRMEVQEDYYGGGSHYWTHRCPRCLKWYTFDTYRFELDPYAPTADDLKRADK